MAGEGGKKKRKKRREGRTEDQKDGEEEILRLDAPSDGRSKRSRDKKKSTKTQERPSGDALKRKKGKHRSSDQVKGRKHRVANHESDEDESDTEESDAEEQESPACDGDAEDDASVGYGDEGAQLSSDDDDDDDDEEDEEEGEEKDLDSGGEGEGQHSGDDRVVGLDAGVRAGKKRKREASRQADDEEEHGRVTKRQRNDQCSVFVGQLPKQCTEKTLRLLFGRFGRILEVNYMFFADTGKAKGSAFIEFASEDAAQASLALNGKKLGDKLLRVNMADRKPKSKKKFNKDKHARTLYVGNLNYLTSERKVKEVFTNNAFPALEEVKLPRFRDSGLRRGFAMVTFKTSKGLDRVIAGMNGAEIDGKKIVVEVVSDNRGTKEPQENTHPWKVRLNRRRRRALQFAEKE